MSLPIHVSAGRTSYALNRKNPFFERYRNEFRLGPPECVASTRDIARPNTCRSRSTRARHCGALILVFFYFYHRRRRNLLLIANRKQPTTKSLRVTGSVTIYNGVSAVRNAKKNRRQETLCRFGFVETV